MKNTFIIFLCISFIGAVSCKKEKQVISNKVIQEKIDSIVASRINEIDNDAKRDLEHRITIEVKVKADSIYNSRKLKDDVKKNVKK